ncbi:phosphatidylinositol 4-phosphate 5-kinase type-1 alpha-like [Sycon ciliatum]|uniref:phosphatidylinositol 4-phosphate 5-kinase type-1 alpha-like n=1 Tax=Sycon ciliatum TaxID=27933 RepID=UPI0031F6D5DA
MADSVADENRPPDGGDEGDGQGMSAHRLATQQESTEGAEGKGKGGEKQKPSEKLGHRRVKGDVITYKKTPTNTLMLSIQLGLEQSIGKITNKPKRDLLVVHCSEKEEVEFAPDGSGQTPAHDYGSFKFKTYAPLAFRHFREEFHIKADDFLVSLCNEQLIELSNPGASGSVFYKTNDDEFIIKTVDHKEATFLRHLLPGYYLNLVQNKRTLLPKFYGLYTFQNLGGNIRIVVMNNLLPSGINYHEKYDLKGSTFKRFASDKELAKKSPTLKDLDFRKRHPEGFFLSSDKYTSVMESMKRDATVLESFKIMDYSLLMGVHNIDEELRSRGEATSQDLASPDHTLSDRPGSFGEGSAPTRRQFFSVVQERGHEEVEALPYRIPDGGISARNAKGDRLVIYIGIIDILQHYRFRKKLEHSFKSVLHDGDTVSVHKPGFYAQRFTEFFSKQVFHAKAMVKRKVSSLKRPRQPSAPVSPSTSSEAAIPEGPRYSLPSAAAVVASSEPDLPSSTAASAQAGHETVVEEEAAAATAVAGANADAKAPVFAAAAEQEPVADAAVVADTIADEEQSAAVVDTVEGSNTAAADAAVESATDEQPANASAEQAAEVPATPIEQTAVVEAGEQSSGSDSTPTTAAAADPETEGTSTAATAEEPAAADSKAAGEPTVTTGQPVENGDMV